MAWTAPMTAVANSVYTAAQFNTHVRDNLNETAPAKATAAGRIFVSTGANAIAERAISSASVATAQTTTSIASFGDLATVGPSVTVTTGAQALVLISCQIENSTAGGGGSVGVAVSGASSVSASTVLRLVSEDASTRQTCTGHLHLTGLTPGSNTFTLKYTTPTGGTATFTARTITVIGL